MRKRTTGEERWAWRHELAPPPELKRFDPPEHELDRAWRHLVLIHTSFQATEQKEYRRLIDGLREIERLFFDFPELDAYYEEWAPVAWAAVRPGSAAPSARIRHVAAIQAQFMEDVYFVLQLARFANALDNRGWMNLFRAWGRSKTFNENFDRLRPTFSGEFEEFYDLYVRDYPGLIEEYPVPHPWDSERAREDPRESVQAAARAGERRGIALHGVFLDSGLQEAGQHPERRRHRGASPGTGSRGVKDEAPTVGTPKESQQSAESSRPQKKMPRTPDNADHHLPRPRNGLRNRRWVRARTQWRVERRRRGSNPVDRGHLWSSRADGPRSPARRSAAWER